MGTTTGPCKLVLWAIAVLKSSVQSCKVRRRVLVANRYHDGTVARKRHSKCNKKKEEEEGDDDEMWWC